MKVSSVVAGWTEEGYRNSKEGLSNLEAVVTDNVDSDIILFPGGFIMDNKNRDKTRKKIEDITRDYDGVIITGFDKFDKKDNIFAYQLIANNGESRLNPQVCSKKSDKVDSFDAKERFMNYKGVKLCFISCGELFNSEFREELFNNRPPEIILGSVHYGLHFQNEPYRKRLNQNSKVAGFYTCHTNSISYDKLMNSRFSGVKPESILEYLEMNLAVINYEFSTDKKYDIQVTRKII